MKKKRRRNKSERKRLVITLISPMRAYKQLKKQAGVNGEITNVLVKVRGAIDTHEGFVNSRNYDAYLMSSIMSYKRAIEFVVNRVNISKVDSWFFFDTWRGYIWKVEFKLFKINVELVAKRDKKKDEFDVKTDKYGNEPMYLRDFIIANEKQKVNKLRKIR